MKKTSTFVNALLILFGSLATPALSQVCNPSGNLILFSNYDGGNLTVNVDQNIPNLRIGICSYEAAKVVITGAFAGNVVGIHYAGYNGTSNNCGFTTSTSFTGQAASTATSIAILPPVTLANPNGNASMKCGLGCSSSANQSGCNTVDQLEAYFLNYFPGSSLHSHTVQYACWSGTYSVSAGGNCCPVVPLLPGSIGSNQTLCRNVIPAAFTSTVASGGTGTILYLWESSITSASAGFNAIATATNAIYSPPAPAVTTYYRRGASTISNTTVYSNVLTITVLPSPTLTASPNATMCAGAPTTLTVSGANSYTWQPGAITGSTFTVSPASSQNYTVTGVNASNCSGTTQVNLTVNPRPAISITSNKTAVCVGGSSTLTATGANSYTWSPSSANTATVQATYPTTAPTTYTAFGSSLQGCQNYTTFTQSVQLCVGIEDVSQDAPPQVAIFPNPNQGEFMIKSATALTAIIINELGQTVRTLRLDEKNNYEAAVTGLANGIYSVELKSGQGSSKQKIMVNK